MSPAMPMQLRFTPADDRCYASTPFWRGKWEVGRAAGFGFGDRPTYGKSEKDGSVAPNNYGDVSKQVDNTRDRVSRPGISLHRKYPSMEEKYRDLSWPKCGPGPGKYDTRIPAGQAGWTNPVATPSFSMSSRPILDGELRAGMGKPGAGDYETRIDPGKSSPIKHGTLYDIKCRGRFPYNDDPGAISPGPARYNHKEGFDSKGLLQKILNVPIPPHMPAKGKKHRPMSMPVPDGAEPEEEIDGEDYSGTATGERGRQGNPTSSKKGKLSASMSGKMQRVESSPAGF